MTLTSREPGSRRRRLRRWRRRVAPWLPWVVGACVCLLVVFGYLAALAVSAARHATTATAALTRVETDVRAGSLPAARSDANRAVAAARAARGEVGGRAFTFAARLPLLGGPLRSLRETSQVLDDVSEHVVLPVVAAADLRVEKSVDGTSFDVSRLASIAPTLTAASSRLDLDVRRLAKVRQVGVASVDRRLVEGRTRLQSAARMLRTLSDTARLAPPMLTDGRVYLVLVQNNAESRATGGLIGAYALLTVDHSHLRLLSAGPNNDLRDADAPVIRSDRLFDDRYAGLGVTTTWRSSNLTPDFPTAASIAAGLWRDTGRRSVDGVVAVDPVALADLLQVTGPVSVEGGRRLTASTAVPYLESGIYTDFPRAADSQRNTYLASATRAVFAALDSRHVSGQRAIRALGRAVTGRHLQLWSRHPEEQRDLSRLWVGGTLPSSSPFLEVVTQNLTGGKVDYYVRREVSYVSTTAPEADDVGAGPQPMDDAVVTVRLTNTAPARGLPPYVDVRADLPAHATTQPGSDKLWLSLYLARGTGYVAASLDGSSLPLHTDEDAGATVLSALVDLPAGQSRTLQVHLLQPAESSSFIYVPQPLAAPDVVAVHRG